MGFTFLHTADWQLGKRFGAFDGDKPALLRDQRLQAVERLAKAASVGGCSAVLVAGDVFDSETVPQSLSAQLLARLADYSTLTWHLLPGNHDPARRGSVWGGLVERGLPANVRVHAESKPAELAPGVVLLPSPLTAKRAGEDPTAWMGACPTAPGTVRIGLAHGSVQGFGSAEEASVRIDPGRVRSAGLAYLALGDWHGTMRISERAWYAGTPEPDGFRDNDPGNVLIVRLEGDAAPTVEKVPTGHFTWSRRTVTLDGAAGLGSIESEVAQLGGSAGRRLLSLELTGAVPLAELGEIDERLARLALQLFHLSADTAGLAAFAGADDLEALAAPALVELAQRLRSASEAGGDEAAAAGRALRRLFSFARQDAGEARA